MFLLFVTQNIKNDQDTLYLKRFYPKNKICDLSAFSGLRDPAVFKIQNNFIKNDCATVKSLSR